MVQEALLNLDPAMPEARSTPPWPFSHIQDFPFFAQASFVTRDKIVLTNFNNTHFSR